MSSSVGLQCGLWDNSVGWSWRGRELIQRGTKNSMRKKLS